ncbi:hypothetical protein Droror1_Dr00026302 [Drosera rotundifolia]
MKRSVVQLVALFFLFFLATCQVEGVMQRHGESEVDESLEADANGRQIYIVYMGSVSSLKSTESSVKEHHDMLVEVLEDEELARSSRLHSFGRSFNGFVAYLLPHEADILSKKESVVSVFRSTNKLRPMTTRSWDFLGMPLGKTKRNPVMESDTIVALLDTGINMEVPSFNDEGFGRPPAKWKGRCDAGLNFTGCNNKVIGARLYELARRKNETDSPADYIGHGSHTASTVAGSIVKDVSFYGMAKGTVRGGVPGARIAMYKVCGPHGCSDHDILAAFDDAIADGVDVISASLGANEFRPLFNDPIAIGSFHAMQKGILAVCSAGNGGPAIQSVVNTAPWVLTVAASNIDREFRTRVTLGNGFKFYGRSINTFTPKKTMYPLTSGILAGDPSVELWEAMACYGGYLLPDKVKGKVLLCQGSDITDLDIMQNGAYGAIVFDDDQQNIDTSFITLLPLTYARGKTVDALWRYVNETQEPTIVLHKTITVKRADLFVASFSSRGPQFMAPNIIKPDIAAPGLDILAGFTKYRTVSDAPADLDKRKQLFNVLSGTSMAAPHVSGAAAYLKTFHPDWSPAAIMSALMTTAKPVYEKGIEHPFHSGSGLLNPTAAIDPGLIYNMSVGSYIGYLCIQGYNSTMLGRFAGGNSSCSDYPKAQGYDAINYPSIHLQYENSNGTFSGIFHRTVTSVTPGKSIYTGTVHKGKGHLYVKVVPDILVFEKQGEEKSFEVTVSGTLDQLDDWVSTVLEWNDGRHKVRSPIVVYRKSSDDGY